VSNAPGKPVSFSRPKVGYFSNRPCMWVWPCIIVNMWKLKGQLDATDWFLYCKTYCSLNVFWAPLCPSSGAQELYIWLLPVVLGALVYRSLVWCGAVGYVSGLRDEFLKNFFRLLSLPFLRLCEIIYVLYSLIQWKKAVFSKFRTEHIDELCGQNIGFWMLHIVVYEITIGFQRILIFMLLVRQWVGSWWN